MARWAASHNQTTRMKSVDVSAPSVFDGASPGHRRTVTRCPYRGLAQARLTPCQPKYVPSQRLSSSSLLDLSSWQVLPRVHLYAFLASKYWTRVSHLASWVARRVCFSITHSGSNNYIERKRVITVREVQVWGLARAEDHESLAAGYERRVIL
ncbi:hypothetical protein K443DRAFT_675505 [Laccaria amethystina LaAM-08-1]|uniref:Uncharacterized protein n=1 Tax=Laccaria amethystina LaAM-08-1 TaxID=1095629 RepID=A0A0C9XJ50_9AGAR|nr:hypothetical protein K443DRAFT_675505 [Laccaria amethystina LaAM-08-1]